MFKKYGLDKIRDSLTESFDYKLADGSWTIVDTKSVPDSDGFLTDYTWYTDGEKHIFMFGDTDLYEPDEDYAHHVEESEAAAKEWFDSFAGFDSDDIWEELDSSIDEDTFEGNKNFLNDGFDRVFGNGLELEE